MPLYREISPRAFRAQIAYAQLIALETRAENDTGFDVATAHRVARSTLYAHQATVLRALEAASPGPQPRSDDAIALRRARQQSQALRTRITSLEAANAALEARLAASIRFDLRTQHALELVLAVENVSLRGVQRVYQVADPDGALWNDRSVAATNAKLAGLLAQLPGEVGAQARTHVERHGHRYASHRHVLFGLAVERTAGATWSVEEILQGVRDVHALEHRASCATGAV